MDLDPNVILQIAFLIMAIVYFFRPPNWIKDLLSRGEEQVKDLKTWAPRLVGALAHGEESYNKQLNNMENSSELVQILGMLPQLAPILNNIPQLMAMMQAYQGQGKQQPNQQNAGMWAK